MDTKEYLKSKGFEHPVRIGTDTTNEDYLLSDLLKEYASQQTEVIEKQEKLIKELNGLINICNAPQNHEIIRAKASQTAYVNELASVLASLAESTRKQTANG